jgi:hypothetical protein
VSIALSASYGGNRKELGWQPVFSFDLTNFLRAFTMSFASSPALFVGSGHSSSANHVYAVSAASPHFDFRVSADATEESSPASLPYTLSSGYMYCMAIQAAYIEARVA